MKENQLSTKLQTSSAQLWSAQKSSAVEQNLNLTFILSLITTFALIHDFVLTMTWSLSKFWLYVNFVIYIKHYLDF